MSRTLTLLTALGAGMAIGVVYFGFLWWTVRRGLGSPYPAVWFSGSVLLRMAFAVAGFYLVSGGQWDRCAACLAGFIAARLVLTRLAWVQAKPVAGPAGANHAP